MSDPQTTRDERFRAWRQAGFGPDEAARRADMPDVTPPVETRHMTLAEQRITDRALRRSLRILGEPAT